MCTLLQVVLGSWRTKPHIGLAQKAWAVHVEAAPTEWVVAAVELKNHQCRQ